MPAGRSMTSSSRSVEGSKQRRNSTRALLITHIREVRLIGGTSCKSIRPHLSIASFLAQKFSPHHGFLLLTGIQLQLKEAVDGGTTRRWCFQVGPPTIVAESRANVSIFYLEEVSHRLAGALANDSNPSRTACLGLMSRERHSLSTGSVCPATFFHGFWLGGVGGWLDRRQGGRC